VEVHDEANGKVEKTHVAQDLGLVDRMNLLDRFHFNEQTGFDGKVKFENLIEDDLLVTHLDKLLSDARNASLRDFVLKTSLVNAF
jgi:hypothetical protein